MQMSADMVQSLYVRPPSDRRTVAAIDAARGAIAHQQETTRMALAPNPAVAAQLSFIDNNNKAASTGFFLPSNLLAVQYSEYVTAFATAVAPLSNAGIRAGSFSFGFFDELVAPAALPNESEVERKLVLVFGTANRYVNITMEIPSPVFTLETDLTDEVDIANPLIQALANLIINGPVGIDNGVVSASGVQVTNLQRAYIRHRSRAPRR